MSDINLESLERYSYSKISCYKQCRFKFKLKYLDKNYLYSGNIATDFGSLVHQTEEQIALALQAGRPVNYVALKNTFIIEIHKLALRYPDTFYMSDKSGKNYLEKSYYYLEYAIYRLEKFITQNPQYKIIGIEQKFEFNYDNIHAFNGSIDRAFLNTETNELLIQDIKTWGVKASNNDLKAPLQFAVYMMAAKNLWDIPFTNIKCEYDLPLCDTVQEALPGDIITEGQQVLNKLFKGIADENFKPTITALCHWCEYNPTVNQDLINTKPEAVCPYFSTWEKSGDDVRNTLITWQDLASVVVDRQFCISQLKQAQLNNLN